MVCLRNMCMATLNKGDNDYNNNNNNNKLLLLLLLSSSSLSSSWCYQSFIYSPTDAPVSSVKKNNIKMYIKIYITTAPTCFGAVTPSSGSALLIFLYCKTQNINQQLYRTHLKCVHYCNGMWRRTRNSINSRLDDIIDTLYQSLIPNSATYTHQQGSINTCSHITTRGLG